MYDEGVMSEGVLSVWRSKEMGGVEGKSGLGWRPYRSTRVNKTV